MDVDTESVKLSLSNELIETVRLLSMEAHKQNNLYITKKHDTSSSSSSTEVFIFAFPGSWKVNDWYQNDHFGETYIDCNLFPSMRRIGENRLAKVNAAFQIRSQHLLNDPKFLKEVKKAVDDGKRILFTGHSSGGATASLVTLWLLDEYVKKNKIKISIGCVTFGSPLIGDRTLSHAVRREKWAGHFTHFVMEHDVVPRIMLSPKISIQEQLPHILDFFQKKVNLTDQKSHKKFPFKKKPKTNDEGPQIDVDEAVKFVEEVMINASTVASHVAFNLMEPTNSLIEKLSGDFVKVSPYRPSGVYVFCTKASQHFEVENPDAVLQLLFYLLQLTDESQNLADFAVDYITESLSYEEVKLENLFVLKNHYKYLLNSDGTAGDVIRTSNTALFELSASARCCLMAAEESENRKKENEKLIDKSMRKYAPKDTKKEKERTTLKIIEDILDECRKHKQKLAQTGKNYYDAFKLQDEYDDFLINIDRLKMAKIFDEIVEMIVRDDLPDEFEGREEWVKVGTEFRRLFEPLDIGNYYRHAKGKGYMGVRPKRYKFTQHWYEHANGTRFKLVAENKLAPEVANEKWSNLASESNFVAEVEEIKKEVEETKMKTVEQVKKELEGVENKVQEWKSIVEIANDEDVFWGDSLFTMLKGKLQ